MHLVQTGYEAKCQCDLSLHIYLDNITCNKKWVMILWAFCPSEQSVTFSGRHWVLPKYKSHARPSEFGGASAIALHFAEFDKIWTPHNSEVCTHATVYMLCYAASKFHLVKFTNFHILWELLWTGTHGKNIVCALWLWMPLWHQSSGTKAPPSVDDIARIGSFNVSIQIQM